MRPLLIFCQFFIFSCLISAQQAQINNSYIENYGLLSETFLNGGYCYEIEVIDNLAYVGTDAGLVIYDISNPVEFELVGFYSCFSVRSFYIDNDIAYLGTLNKGNSWKGKIEIIDITDTSEPIQIFSYEIYGYVMGPGRGLNVKDNYIFISYGKLYIIDINDLNNPVVYTYNSIHPFDMVVDEDILYVVSYGNMKIYNISDITNIELLSSVNCSGNNLQVKGNFAYISGGSLKIVNISDPNNPEVLSETYFTNNYARDVKVKQPFAYVTGYNNENGIFAIVDIFNPLDPSILYESTDYLGSNIFVKDNKAFISGSTIYEYGIITLDVSNPSNVNSINITRSSTAMKCKVYNNTAFVANGHCGITLINITDILNPIEISSTLTKGVAVDVLKDSNILYVAEADSGIQIFGIINPSQPVLLSEHCSNNSWDGYLKLDKYQNYLYTGGGGWINDIIDVSDPENPVLVGTIPVNDWGYDIQIMGQHLFVAGYWGGFQIFTLEDPVNPVEVGYYPLGLALKITVSKELAYIYDNTNILIFDISNFTNPTLVSTYNPGQYVSVYHMYAQGDTLYYSNALSQINVLDVSNSNNPVIVDSIVDIRAISFDFLNNNFITHDEYLLRIIGDTTTISTDDNLDLREEYYLHQNIPNPCSENTSITIFLPETMNIKLELYNNIGRKLITLIDRRLNKGEHTIRYNTVSLKQGIYYYRLIIDDKYTESKKMLVVKY